MDLRELFIVDDNVDHRYLLQQIFNKYIPDCAVRFFEGGEQLYRHIDEQTDIESGNSALSNVLPAAIILDLHMPYLNGIQFLNLLKKNPEGKHIKWAYIPVIVMTSLGNEQQVLECYEAGASAFVKKPEEFLELKNLLISISQFWIGANRIPQLSAKQV